MRRILFPLFCLFAGGLQQIHAQAPEYTLLLPVYTDEGSYVGDYDLGRSVVSAAGEVRYGLHRPQILAQLGVREYAPTAVSDGTGGMILFYTIEHVDSANSGDTDILLRRVDSDGKDLWDDSVTGAVRFLADSPNLERNPVAIPIDNGILIVYEIEYTSGEFRGDVDIAARFLRGGDHELSDESLWIASSDRRETAPQVVRSRGASIVIFERLSATPGTEGGDIIAVRVSDDGQKGWTGGSPEVSVAGSSHEEGSPAITSDGQGGVYVAYELRYVSGDKEGDIDVIAQHLDGEGRRMWTDPIRPPIVASSNRALERKPAVSADSTGLVVAFEIISTETAGSHPNSAIGLQRLDTAGQALWNRGTRSTVVSAKHRIGLSPHLVTDLQGGRYVLFDGIDTITGDRDVFAQHADSDGALSWNRENAVPVFYGPMPERLIDAREDGNGGVVVFAAEIPVYRTESSEPRDTTIIAHRLNRFGEHTWGIGENNLLVTQAILGEYPPVLVSLGQ